MNTLHLRSFVVVAECGSISAAARQLFISHTSLQQQIRLLERELGFDLFHRSHAGVSMTKAGAEFYRRATRILDGIDSAVKDCSILASGVERILKMAHLPTRECASACFEFESLHPNIRFEHYSAGEGSWELLLGGELDFCEHVRLDEFDFEGLCFTELCEIDLCCMVSPSHPLGSRKSVTFEDIAAFSPATCDDSGDLVSLLQNVAASQGVRLVVESGRHDEDSVLRHCAAGGVFLAGPRLPIVLQRLSIVPVTPKVSYRSGLIHRVDLDDDAASFLSFVRELSGSAEKTAFAVDERVV